MGMTSKLPSRNLSRNYLLAIGVLTGIWAFMKDMEARTSSEHQYLHGQSSKFGSMVFIGEVP